MATKTSNLQLFRRLSEEIRHLNPKVPIKEQPLYNFVSDLFRQHQVTSRKVCRSEQEMQHLAETYLCYLKSSRKYKELSIQYKGSGEKTTEASANLVGLTMPKLPED